MIRYYLIISIFISSLMFAACAAEEKPETPKDTLKAYTVALKKKDMAAMKSLLTGGSLKMAADEAKAQNVSIDDILGRETLFAPEQKVFEVRNEKIEGDSATIEVKNSFGSFERVPLVRENGVWKIAKDKYAEEMMKQADEEMKQLDDQFNQSKQP